MIALINQADPEGRLTAVAPRGPHPSRGGPSWFTANQDDHGDTTLTESLRLIDELIEHESEVLGAEPARTLIIGYSQGGATALALALRADAPHRFDEVIAIAGYLPQLGRSDDGGLDWAFADAAGSTSVLLVHGTHDEAVPVMQSRSAARVLARNGIEVDLVEADAGHGLGGTLNSVVTAHLAHV